MEEITNRILSDLISTELAKNCSHSGKGKKSKVGLQGPILDLIYSKYHQEIFAKITFVSHYCTFKNY